MKKLSDRIREMTLRPLADKVALLEDENERLRGLLAKANHYTSCYNLHFPDSGANWVEEEVNKVLERGECWIAERD